MVHTFPDLNNNPFYSLNDQRHEFKIVNVLKAVVDLAQLGFMGVKPYTAPNGIYTITLLMEQKTVCKH